MPDFYEIDFLPVHTSKSGDCICVRYQIGSTWTLHVVDGGYTDTAPDLAAHIDKYFGTKLINHVVVTHPDQDHAEGLAPILEYFDVGKLWMLRPWIYAQELLPHFPRIGSVENLQKRLRDDYPYIATLEEIALRRGIVIDTPFQGRAIGAFTVLAPSPLRYGQLILSSDRTPQIKTATAGILSGLFNAIEPLVTYIKSGWGSENFSSENTSVENEMSVVQYANIAGHRILLTGDAGRDAMTEAADYAPTVGLFLPGIFRFQVPHHGGRRNLSSDIVDRWLGPRFPSILPAGQETFTAMISSAKEDTAHPRNAVLRAMLHRGAFVGTTEDGPMRVAMNSPAPAWSSMKNVAYPDEQEE
jgi:hypothetical protein